MQVVRMDACERHPKYEVAYFNINSEQMNNICPKCLTDFHYNSKQLIPIPDIVSDDHNGVYSNWPIFEEKYLSDIQNKLRRIQAYNILEQILKTIDQFYTTLQEDVSKIISESKKKMISQAYLINESRISVMQEYEKLSEMSEFRKLWKDLYAKKEEASGNMSNFLERMNNESTQNQNSIQQVLNTFTNELNYLIQEQPSSISNVILSTTKTNSQIFQQNLIQQFQELQVSDETTTYQSQTIQKVDQIMSLIGNKSNFCNDNFLSHFKSKLLKYSHILDDLNISSFNQENQSPISFDKLELNELQEIKCFIEENQNLELSNLSKENEQFLLFSQQFKPKNQKMKNIFQKMLLLSNYQKTLSMNDIYFTKCTFGSSQYLNFKKEKDSYTIDKQQPDDILSRAYSSFILDNDKKYIFRYKMPRSMFPYVKVDIIADDKKDNPNEKVENLCFHGQSTYYQERIEYRFEKDQNSINKNGQLIEVEMRVSIRDKHIAITNYPFQHLTETINCSNNASYRLFFSLKGGTTAQSFILFFAQTLDSFDI